VDGAQRGPGALRAAPRPGGPSVAAAVRDLFAGPTQDEAPVLATRLPTLHGVPSVQSGGRIVVIRLPAGSGPLSASGMLQVVCTAAAALPPEPVTPDSPGRAAHAPAGGQLTPSGSLRSGAAPVKVLVNSGGWEASGTNATCPAT
jgi:hypothetical protein